LIALDFFGASLRRVTGESDSAFRQRISWALFQGAATRSEIGTIIQHLTGFPPKIFEPRNCGDAGSYSQNSIGLIPSYQGMAYGAAGGWGSLEIPLQFFVTVKRPIIGGMSMLAGYGSGAGGFGDGSLAYVDIAQVSGAITNQDVASTLSAALPINTIAWLRLI
jgi:hypothetical protein